MFYHKSFAFLTNNSLIFRIIFIAYLLFISYFSVKNVVPVRRIETDSFEFRLDYLYHFLSLGLLTVLFFISFVKIISNSNMTILVISLVLLIFYATIIEYVQNFIPGRTYNPYDLIANISGVLIACISCIMIIKSDKKMKG